MVIHGKLSQVIIMYDKGAIPYLILTLISRANQGGPDAHPDKPCTFR